MSSNIFSNSSILENSQVNLNKTLISLLNGRKKVFKKMKCSDDPCGPGVACFPTPDPVTSQDFKCICDDGTEVQPYHICHLKIGKKTVFVSFV